MGFGHFHNIVFTYHSRKSTGVPVYTIFNDEEFPVYIANRADQIKRGHC